MTERGYSALSRSHQEATIRSVNAVEDALDHAHDNGLFMLFAMLSAWANSSLENVKVGRNTRTIFTVSPQTQVRDVKLRGGSVIDEAYVSTSVLVDARVIKSFVNKSTVLDSYISGSVIDSSFVRSSKHVNNSTLQESVANRSEIYSSKLTDGTAVTESRVNGSVITGPSTCIASYSIVTESVVNAGITLLHMDVVDSTLTKAPDGKPLIYLAEKLNQVNN